MPHACTRTSTCPGPGVGTDAGAEHERSVRGGDLREARHVERFSDRRPICREFQIARRAGSSSMCSERPSAERRELARVGVRPGGVREDRHAGGASGGDARGRVLDDRSAGGGRVHGAGRVQEDVREGFPRATSVALNRRPSKRGGARSRRASAACGRDLRSTRRRSAAVIASNAATTPGIGATPRRNSSKSSTCQSSRKPGRERVAESLLDHRDRCRPPIGRRTSADTRPRSSRCRPAPAS